MGFLSRNIRWRSQQPSANSRFPKGYLVDSRGLQGRLVPSPIIFQGNKACRIMNWHFSELSDVKSTTFAASRVGHSHSQSTYIHSARQDCSPLSPLLWEVPLMLQKRRTGTFGCGCSFIGPPQKGDMPHKTARYAN